MKSSAIATLIFALFVSNGVLAQSGDMKGMDMKGMDMKGMDMKSMPMEKKAKATSYKATGVVKNVDAGKGTVTVAHEPVKDLNWPAMTMAFVVKDKKMLDKFAADKKVSFEFVKQGADYVVTSIK